MARVPDQAVLAEVKDAVQRQAQFNHAQVGGEMGASLCHQVAQHVTDFRRQFGQLADGHGLKCLRLVDLRQQAVHVGSAVPFQHVTGQRL